MSDSSPRPDTYFRLLDRVAAGEDASAVEAEMNRQVKHRRMRATMPGSPAIEALALAERQLLREVARVRDQGSASERDWLATLLGGTAPVLVWLGERSAAIEAAAIGMGLPEASVVVEVRHAAAAAQRARREALVSALSPDEDKVLEAIAGRDFNYPHPPSTRMAYHARLQETARLVADQRAIEEEAARTAAYWAAVTSELFDLAVQQHATYASLGPFDANASLRRSRVWIPVTGGLLRFPSLDKLIQAKERKAIKHGAAPCAPSPVFDERETARFLANQRAIEEEAARTASYWAAVTSDLLKLAADQHASHASLGPFDPEASLCRSRVWNPVTDNPLRFSSLDNLIKAKELDAIKRGATPVAPPPDLNDAEDVPPAPRKPPRLHDPRLAKHFPSPADQSADAVRDRLYMATPRDAVRSLLKQLSGIVPDLRALGLGRRRPEFTKLVAAVMSHGNSGRRLMLMPHEHPGIALIDVRRPRTEFVAQWRACLRVAADCADPGAFDTEDLTRVSALPPDVTIEEVVVVLGQIGLGLAIGVASDGT